MSLLSPELNAFLAVINYGTVLEASRQIGLTQTGVTQRIRRLEASLNVTLFTRSRTGMRPTAEGQALLQYCRGCLELEGETLSKMGSGGKDQPIEIRLSGPSSLMHSRVIPSLAIFQEKWPQLRFHFDIADDNSGLPKLKQGLSQIVILPRSSVLPEFDSKLLKPEIYRIVVPTRWSSRRLIDVVREERIVDFDPQDQMTFNYLDKFGLRDHARADRHFANNTETLANLVSLGFGYSVLTKEFAEPMVASGQLGWLKPDQVFENFLALVWYSRPDMPGYFKDIVKAIK